MGGTLTAGTDSNGGVDGSAAVTYGKGPWSLAATVGLRNDLRPGGGDGFRINRFEAVSLRTTLMTPPTPSGSNAADGLGMISTRSTVPAGRLWRYEARKSPWTGAGRPSMNTATLPAPRSDTLPSTSTSTDGSVASTSVTVPPSATGSSAVS